MSGNDPYKYGVYQFGTSIAPAGVPLQDLGPSVPGLPGNVNPTPGLPGNINPAPGIIAPGARAPGVPMVAYRIEVGTEAVSVLPARLNRQYLLIQNASGSGVIYIAFGAVADAFVGFEIISGGSIEIRDPAPTNDVSIVCPGGTAIVRILEG